MHALYEACIRDVGPKSVLHTVFKLQRMQVYIQKEWLLPAAKKLLTLRGNVPFMCIEKTSGDYAATRDVLMEVLAEHKNVAGYLMI